MTNDIYKQAEELGIDKKLVEQMINSHKLFEWNINTLQSLLSNQNSNHEGRSDKKKIF